MARIETDPNYTAPTFSRATEPTDLFKKEDVQNLAAAVSTHTHTPGRGAVLSADSIPNGSITSAKISGGTLALSGPLSAAGINSSQNVTAATYLAAGAVISGQSGDVTANRGNNTGYLWLGNSTHYVGFDGTNYSMPNSNLVVNGGLVATQSNGMTLQNKVYENAQLTGTVAGAPAWASAQNFPVNSTIRGVFAGTGLSFDFVVTSSNYTLPSTPVGVRKMLIFIRAGASLTVFSSTGAGSFWVGQVNYATTGYALTDGQGLIIGGSDGNWFAVAKTANPW